VAFNTCSQNHWAGIAIRDEGTNPVIGDNQCIDNGCWSILVYALADADLTTNTAFKNNDKTIKIRKNAGLPLLITE
jgi:parallel beta-helix repeat protein